MATLGVARAGLFLLIVVILCNQSDAKQLIRLRSGLECPQPGYFRDVEDCKRFYYCPSLSIQKAQDEAHLTPEELHIMQEITRLGMECPEGYIFYEPTTSCQNLLLVDSVPPECKLPRKKGIVGEKPETLPEYFNNQVL